MGFAGQIYQSCDHAGETAVRKTLADGGYTDQQIPIVKMWLARQSDLSADEAKSPEARAARSAKNAAWAAAYAAIIAAVAATVSAVIAYLSFRL